MQALTLLIEDGRARRLHDPSPPYAAGLKTAMMLKLSDQPRAPEAFPNW